MIDLFVSYKREDSAKVGKVVAALRDAGLDVWWDADIPASVPWEATIEKALRDAKAVIVCWSPASVASENVRSEARVAREDGRLIQAFVKPCTPPLFFGERQGIDLTKWRGNADDPRIAKIAEAARAIARGERAEADGPFLVRKLKSFNARVAASLAALVIIAGAALGWWFLSPATASGPQTLAVLPFRALTPADTNLVDAIWDDTRGAISKNPNLRVLGRQTVESLAKSDLDPAGYRKKVGADYLLDGNVQHAGDKILMNVSLVRTKDGTQVWSDSIGGKLDDVFAFQQRIAREVEGRIRGRVAPEGGIKAQNIATSGRVYMIYADAHALVRKRNPDNAQEAIDLLHKALAIDPNYAPAWADLGIASNSVSRPANDPEEFAAEPIRYLKRALVLAPNLAHAHAALAMVQHMPPESEPELRRAVALDPNDADAWMWLGSLYAAQNRMKDAVTAYGRAAEIEPLLRPNNGNLAVGYVILHDWKGLNAVVQRVSESGDPALIAHLQYSIALARGRPGDALRTMLELRSQHPENAAWIDPRAANLLQQLGYIDEAQTLWNNTAEVAGEYRGIPESPSVLWAGWKTPADFWKNNDGAAVVGRNLIKHGRLAEYVSHYRSAFRTTGDFIAARSFTPDTLAQVTPTVAVVLRAGGAGSDADELLRRTEPILTTWLRNGPARPDYLANLAYYRAAEGMHDQAVELLRRAVDGGWLPDNQYFAMDVGVEPCFAALISRPDFQQVRRRILTRIEEERRKAPPALVSAAYPVRLKAA